MIDIRETGRGQGVAREETGRERDVATVPAEFLHVANRVPCLAQPPPQPPSSPSWASSLSPPAPHGRCISRDTRMQVVSVLANIMHSNVTHACVLSVCVANAKRCPIVAMLAVDPVSRLRRFRCLCCDSVYSSLTHCCTHSRNRKHLATARRFSADPRGRRRLETRWQRPLPQATQ